MFTKSEKLTRSSLSPTNLLLEVRSVKPIQMGSFFYKNLSSTWSPVKKVILNPMERFFIASKLSWKMAAVKSENNLTPPPPTQKWNICITKTSSLKRRLHRIFSNQNRTTYYMIKGEFYDQRWILWSNVNFMIKGEFYDFHAFHPCVYPLKAAGLAKLTARMFPLKIW